MESLTLGGEKLKPSDIADTENSTLHKMINVKNCLSGILQESKKNKDIIFVFGDLQDTPDNS